MKKLFALAVFLLLPFFAQAEIAKLEFVTPARVVTPGALSEIITVQTKNSAGASEKITETADVSFTSSSPTGEFLNDKGDPARLVMASSTANRSFYYRDSAQGTATLTVTVTARSGSWFVVARQTVTVGQAAPVEPEPIPEPEPAVAPAPSASPSERGEPPTSPSLLPSVPPSAPVAPILASTSTASSTVVITNQLPAPTAAPLPPATNSVADQVVELKRLNEQLTTMAANLAAVQAAKSRETAKLSVAPPVAAVAGTPASPTTAPMVIEIPKPPSFFGRLVAWPAKLWQAVKNLFRRP